MGKQAWDEGKSCQELERRAVERAAGPCVAHADCGLAGRVESSTALRGRFPDACFRLYFPGPFFARCIVLVLCQCFRGFGFLSSHDFFQKLSQSLQTHVCRSQALMTVFIHTNEGRRFPSPAGHSPSRPPLRGARPARASARRPRVRARPPVKVSGKFHGHSLVSRRID